jgi:hypothetical protein
VPEARVEHCIGHERQTVAYIARYYVSLGETYPFFESITARTRFLFGVPRWLWRRLFESWLRYHICRFICPAPIWVRHLRAHATAYGAIRYWRGQRRYRPDTMI